MQGEPPSTPTRDALTTLHPRVAHILDAAVVLLLRWGYKRVTIDDIAQHSAIGKGTIYLHWRTREALFHTLLLRELVTIWRLLLHELRTDPTTVRLSRLMRVVFLTTMQRPLARALFTGDREVLGKLAASDSSHAIRSQHVLASQEFLSFLRSNGLLRTDSDLVTQGYALHATVSGFFLLEPSVTTASPLTLDQQADALAHTVHHAFEPAPVPVSADLRTSAERLIHWIEQLCTDYDQQIRILSSGAAARAQ